MADHRFRMLKNKKTGKYRRVCLGCGRRPAEHRPEDRHKAKVKQVKARATDRYAVEIRNGTKGGAFVVVRKTRYGRSVVGGRGYDSPAAARGARSRVINAEVARLAPAPRARRKVTRGQAGLFGTR